MGAGSGRLHSRPPLACVPNFVWPDFRVGGHGAAHLDLGQLVGSSVEPDPLLPAGVVIILFISAFELTRSSKSRDCATVGLNPFALPFYRIFAATWFFLLILAQMDF